MPAKDGWTVLKELKTSDITKNISVIIVSLVEDESIANSLGAAAIIKKTIYYDELIAEVENNIRSGKTIA